MRKRTLPRHTQRQNNTEETLSWRYYLIAGVCCCILAAGFFFAARQHFSSIDYGIRNSRLRKQLDELEAEKRRLLVAKEISLTPAELKKAAKRIGIYDSAAVMPEHTGETTLAAKTRETASAFQKASTANKVIPIVMSAPVSGAEKLAKQTKSDAGKGRKDRS